MGNRRVFGISGFKPVANTDYQERLERLQVAQQAMTQTVLSHPKAQEMGVTEASLDQARTYIRGLGNAENPLGTVGGAARVDNGSDVIITDGHVNGHGEVVREGYRRNGPHFERIRVVEERIDPRTTIVTRRMGGR